MNDAASNEKEAPSMRVSTDAGSPKDEQDLDRILRKVDFCFLSILTLLFMLSFLDRTAIGHALIAGLPKDLKLHGTQLNDAISVFWSTYGFVEIPTVIALRHLNARYFMAFIVVGWGLVTISHGFLENYTGLMIARVFLGFFEAGLVPCCVFLMSLWYPRKRLVFRMTLFFSGTLLAGAFGGFLARGIVQPMNGIRGLPGWKWLFILEGAFTVLVGLLLLLILPETVDRALFLKPAEKEFLTAYIAADSKQENTHFAWNLVGDAFKDPFIWVTAVNIFAIGLTTQNFAAFLPSIIRAFGYSTTRTMLFSAFPYIAALVCISIAGFTSDRIGKRFPLVIFGACVGIFGYLLLITIPTKSHGARYFATFIVTCGVWTAGAINLGWMSNNVLGYTKRAVAIAIQATVMCAGGVVGGYSYPKKDEPAYRIGHGVALAVLTTSLATVYLQKRMLEQRLKEAESQASEESAAPTQGVLL